MTRVLIESTNWRHLLRDLLATSEGKTLKQFPSARLADTLAAAASVANWIVHFAPELAKREKLHLVIAGAAFGQDSIDDGRWYQFVPVLLGNPAMHIEVDLVGKELAATATPERFGGLVRFPNKPWPSRAPAAVQHLPSATLHGKTLGEYFAERAGLPPPNLVFMFHPGFQEHSPEWLHSGDLRLVIGLGIPVGAAAFASDEQMHEAWLLTQYGYGVEGMPLINPFAGSDAPGTPIPMAFAKVLWKLAPKAPAADRPLSQEAEEKNELYERWCGEWIMHGNALPPMSAFGCVCTDLQHPETGEQLTTISVPPNVFVSVEDGVVYARDEGGQVIETDVELPFELIEMYPKDSPLDFERAVWSIQVCEYLDQAYEDEPADNGRNLFDLLQTLPEGMAAILPEFASMVEQFREREGSRRPQTPGSARFFRHIANEEWTEAATSIAKNPDLVHAADKDGKTALFHSVDARRFDFAERLLAAGAEPSPYDNEGFTPLHDAASHRNPEGAALLLRYGADIEIKSYMGWPPLLTAMMAGADDVTKLLVEAGASLHTANQLGLTAAALYEEVPLRRDVRELIRQRLEASRA